MPGLVVFKRRWSVGSDDLVVPGVFLFMMHVIWTIVLTVILCMVNFDRTQTCINLLWGFILGYLVVLSLSLATELWISIVAMRGSILDTTPRASMKYLLYVRVVLLLIETGWLTAGIVWLVKFYSSCNIEKAKETVLGLVVCNWCILVSVLITVWCTYDAAGRSWVKMKKYQRSMRESESKFQYKRSGSTRNWRQRKVLRAYEDSWHQRCRFLFCCMQGSDRNRNSFADIARLLSDFFRDLDVVPSDVVAGLVLLRKFQKIERKAIVEQRKNDTYEFLSGVAVTPRTQFLSLQEGADLELFQTVIHYAHYAVRAYGWPMYVLTETMGVCQICTGLSCCCLPCQKRHNVELIDDNCCNCNYAALQKIRDVGDIEIIYATFHVDVGETPFFVALDYDRKKVVVSIRGTLSMKDILTDLNAESETLPLDPPQEEWTGHKGMVQASQYIYHKLRTEDIIEKALNYNPERGTRDFQLVTVGHSLGAGTASILGILLRQDYPELLSYCYSPPGGLLSMPAVDYTKSFTISVVIGKDVVPRIGLHQMEALRADLINAIKRSVDPKWKTITCSMVCCGICCEPTSALELKTNESDVLEYMKSRDHARCQGLHPSDSSIALTSHQPLYPPGRIIHVVRHHTTRGELKYEKRWRQSISKREPVFQALWAQNTDFDEVLISPVMIQDHMPDTVLNSLRKVITSTGPRKPQRITSSNNNSHKESDEYDLLPPQPLSTSSSPTTITTTLLSSTQQQQQQHSHQHRLYLETSFTSLQSPTALIPYNNNNNSNTPSVASSITNGYHTATISQPSPLPLSNIMILEATTIRPKIQININKPKSLSLNLKRTSSDALRPIDLIHDDWFGLAPLASPESLSEVSSISSRASFTTNLDRVKPLSYSYELKTPKVMRRTPKIIGNLNTCADDIRNVRYFQKLGQLKYLRRPSHNGSSITTSSNSNLSYESATSNTNDLNVNNDCNVLTYKVNNSYSDCSAERGIVEESFIVGYEENVKEINNDDDDDDDNDAFQSAEDILDSVMVTAGCADYFNSKTTFLETHFDDDLLFQTETKAPNLISPQNIDQDVISNFAIDLNLPQENQSLQFNMRNQQQQQFDCNTTYTGSKTNSIESGSTCCRTPSEHKIVTFNPQVINIESPISSPTFKRKKSDRWHLLPLRRHKKESRQQQQQHKQQNKDIQYQLNKHISKTDHLVPKTILCSSKRRNSDDDFFSRTEALPLLSGLSNVNVEKTSPNFVRRKKYVYPAITVINKNESSV